MQRTVRVLRIALPIALVAFILVIALSWRRNSGRRERPEKEIVTSTIRPGEKRPQLESKSFEDTQTIAGRVASRIRARRVVAFSSGWNTLEGVELTIFRPNGLTYDVMCPTAQFNSNTKEADAKGGVFVQSSDGVEIRTAEIHFDGSHLTNHIPVQFKIDRWTGTGGALDLDVQGEQLRLYQKLDATMHPEAADESPMNLKSEEGVFRRRENDVNFLANVLLTRDYDRLFGDHMVAHFAQNRHGLVAVEGNGHIIIRMASNSPIASGENLGGQKEITCDRFFSELAANGQISAINAVGDTALAHAVVEGPPKRDMVAKTFRVGLTNKIVSDIKGDWGVVVKELEDPPRELSGDHVNVFFDAATHKESTAAVEGNFKYHDPRNSATAIRANYDITSDSVVLTAEPGFDPSVVMDGNNVRAKLIQFSPRAGTAKATGEVIALLVSKPGGNGGASADSTNIFPTNKPVFVNSDTLTTRQDTKTAIFSGNVRAWQETNTLFAQEMQVQGNGDSLTARGNVRTVLYNTSSTGSGEPRKTPLLSRSDQLFGQKNTRRIDLNGSVKIDDETRHVTSDKAAFFFDEHRHVERMEAESKVVMTDTATGRKSTGDKATYIVANRMVYMSGNPATATDPQGNVVGQQIAIDLVKNKVDIMSPTAPTKLKYEAKPKP